MDLERVLKLYDYNVWANRQLRVASTQLHTETFVAPVPNSFGSLRGTLVHILDMERAWRTLCQYRMLDAFGALDEASFPTVGALERRWQQEEREMRDYLTSLSDDALQRYVRYTTDEGEERERLLWHCLWHVVNHGTHHRSDAAAILRSFGIVPFGLDFTRFLSEEIR